MARLHDAFQSHVPAPLDGPFIVLLEQQGADETGDASRINLYAPFVHKDGESVHEDRQNRANPPFWRVLVTPTGLEPVFSP